jgi:cytochrome c peroxidase
LGTNPCIETSHRRNRREALHAGPNRLSHIVWCSGLAAVLLMAPCAARAQTPPPGQAQIAHSAKTAPISIAALLGLTPATIPESSVFLDGTGVMTDFLPTGPVSTSASPFFDTTITANGRSCFTCHIPPGWTISPPQIALQYVESSGKSPLFQPIDSANCPNTKGATASPGAVFVAAHSQLFNRGNFRIGINAPNPLDPYPNVTTFEGNTPSGDNTSTANPEWILTVKSDPTGCENDPTYGLPAGLLSVYRRTMPSANVAFVNPGARNAAFERDLSNIMWDAREPSLEQQFIDATEFHGQASDPSILHPLDPAEGAAFQQGVFAEQTLDFVGGDLTGGDGSGALGGPVNLFESRENIPTTGSPSCFTPESLDGVDFCPGTRSKPSVFTTFATFADATGGNPAQIAQRESIARGETIFNTRTFTISNVPGLNDVTGPANGSRASSTGTCSTCHNNGNVGNDDFLDPKRTDIMDNGSTVLPPTPDFPLFAFFCPIAPFGSPGHMNFFSNPVQSPYCQELPGSPTTCNEFDTTDPGEGLADGLCNDLGKFKVPVLRGLAARAPYFHGGNVATLAGLVTFYNNRFNIGLSAQDQTDLINFLNSL